MCVGKGGEGGGNVHTRTLRQSSATLSLRYPVGAAAWLKPLHGGRLQVMMMENNEVEKWREESSAFRLVQTGFGGPKEQPPHPPHPSTEHLIRRKHQQRL